ACAAIAAAVAGAGCGDSGGGRTLADAPPIAACDPTSIAPTTVAPGVRYYDCSATPTSVHIVTIDRARPDSAIWLLDDVLPGTPVALNLQTVEDHTRRYNAV